MKKQIWVIACVGIVGMSLLAFARPVATETNANLDAVAKSAYVSESQHTQDDFAKVLLDRVIDENTDVNTDEGIEKSTQEVAVPCLENGSGVVVTSVEGIDKLEKEKEKKEVNMKELFPNLRYDRLGIAKNVDRWLNIREKGSINAKIVGKLPKNAACNIVGINKEGWAKIQSGKLTGYVKSEYLVTDKEAEAYALEVGTLVATVKTTTLNARFLPSEDAAKYTLIPEGEELEVFRENPKESFVEKFKENHFKGKKKVYIKDVNDKEMYQNLDAWVCVRVDREKVFVHRDYVDISYQLKKAVAVETLSENQSAGVTSTRVRMVEFAKQFLGNRYVWGGTSLTSGTDCSGFTQAIYRNFGYSLPRTSRAQSSASRAVSSSDVRPGDLFFYGAGSGVNHVAMYIGGGQVIHASNARDGIKISNAYYRTPIKIGRFIND